MHKPAFLVLAASGLLFACGGGSDGGGSNDAPGGNAGGGVNNPPAANERPGGLWAGTTTNDQLSGFQQIVGISTDDGRFRFLSLETAGQFIGTLRVDGATFTGAGTGYAPVGATWIDGSIFTRLDVDGTLDERQSLSGDWSTGTGEAGTFSLTYDTLYERDSSLSLLAATWTGFDAFANPVSTLTVDASGRIDGQDAAGCLYTGQASLIDASVNVYDLAVTVMNCGTANGAYQGLGFLSDGARENSVFVYSIDDGSLALIGVLER